MRTGTTTGIALWQLAQTELSGTLSAAAMFRARLLVRTLAAAGDATVLELIYGDYLHAGKSTPLSALLWRKVLRGNAQFPAQLRRAQTFCADAKTLRTALADARPTAARRAMRAFLHKYGTAGREIARIILP